MPDYCIVMPDPHTMMVNGEVCRRDDYDYADPDHHRQVAMEMCEGLLAGRDNFNMPPDRLHYGKGIITTAVANVAHYLYGVNPMWQMMMPGGELPQPPITADDLLEAAVAAGQAALRCGCHHGDSL